MRRREGGLRSRGSIYWSRVTPAALVLVISVPAAEGKPQSWIFLSRLEQHALQLFTYVRIHLTECLIGRCPFVWVYAFVGCETFLVKVSIRDVRAEKYWPWSRCVGVAEKKGRWAQRRTPLNWNNTAHLWPNSSTMTMTKSSRGTVTKSSNFK